MLNYYSALAGSCDTVCLRLLSMLVVFLHAGKSCSRLVSSAQTVTELRSRKLHTHIRLRGFLFLLAEVENPAVIATFLEVRSAFCERCFLTLFVFHLFTHSFTGLSGSLNVVVLAVCKGG